MHDLASARFAFLDLETTGLSPWFGDRVCEVGMVLTEGRRIHDTYQTLVNPERPLSFGAASTNGLKDEELAAAPLFGEVAAELAARLEGSIIVCHNAAFDLQFLDNEYRRLGREIQVPNLIDTLLLARQYFQFPSKTSACPWMTTSAYIPRLPGRGTVSICRPSWARRWGAGGGCTSRTWMPPGSGPTAG